MIRVAVLGGTFDPPTNGHLEVARAALDQLDVDEVWLLPAGAPVAKPAASPAADRVALCRLAVAAESRIDVCELETRRPGPTYTVDTLRRLAELPIDITYLVGDDVDLDTWRDAAECRRLARFCRVPRAGYPHRHDLPRLRVPPGPEISSTLVRARRAAGLSLHELVPAAVADALAGHAGAASDLTGTFRRP